MVELSESKARSSRLICALNICFKYPFVIGPRLINHLKKCVSFEKLVTKKVNKHIQLLQKDDVKILVLETNWKASGSTVNYWKPKQIKWRTNTVNYKIIY